MIDQLPGDFVGRNPWVGELDTPQTAGDTESQKVSLRVRSLMEVSELQDAYRGVVEPRLVHCASDRRVLFSPPDFFVLLSIPPALPAESSIA
jgi:hypothetical protein